MSTLEIAPFLMVRVWQFNSWHNSLLFEVSGVLMEKPKQQQQTLCCIEKESTHIFEALIYEYFGLLL